MVIFWLVVSTHLKNISQIGSFPQVEVKIKNIWNHHPVFDLWLIEKPLVVFFLIDGRLLNPGYFLGGGKYVTLGGGKVGWPAIKDDGFFVGKSKKISEMVPEVHVRMIVVPENGLQMSGF